MTLRPGRLTLCWAAVILVITSLPGRALTGVPVIPYLDKVAHALMYGVLGLAAGRERVATGVALPLSGSVFGALDELHQAWIPGRSADPADWVADTIGFLIGLRLSLTMMRSRRPTIHGV